MGSATVTTYDFCDGYGPIPAHRHPNGGGWVADNATVAETALVRETAQVQRLASIAEGASIGVDASIGKDARVYAHAHVPWMTEVAEGAHVSILPTGEIEAWKRLRGGVIARLVVPAEAPRVQMFTSSVCRAAFVRVAALEHEDGTPYEGPTPVSRCDGKTPYPLGEIVRPDSFDPNPDEISHGIYFYLRRQEAVHHV